MEILRYAVLFAVIVLTFFLFDLSVLAILRISGVPVVSRYWRWRGANEATVRSLGKRWYVFIEGVLWCWEFFAAMAISDYAKNIFMGGRHELTPGVLIFRFSIWSAVGIWYGLSMWKWKSASSDRQIRRAS